MQPAEILAHLQQFTRTTLRMKTLGEALAKHGFKKWRKTVKGAQLGVYSVVKKSTEQVNKESQAIDDYTEIKFTAYQTNKELKQTTPF